MNKVQCATHNYFAIGYFFSLLYMHNAEKTFNFALTSHMDKIRHTGTIVSLGATSVKVRVLQQEACSACTAKSLCHSADAKEKDIDVACDASRYEVGQGVVIEGDLRMVRKAVAWAYVVPLMLLMTVTLGAVGLGASEPLAALLGVACLVPYGMVLYALREKMRRQFTFYIKERV